MILGRILWRGPGRRKTSTLAASSAAVTGGLAESGRPYANATCSPSRGITPFIGSKAKSPGRRKLLMPEPISETADRRSLRANCCCSKIPLLSYRLAAPDSLLFRNFGFPFEKGWIAARRAYLGRTLGGPAAGPLLLRPQFVRFAFTPSLFFSFFFSRNLFSFFPSINLSFIPTQTLLEGVYKLFQWIRLKWNFTTSNPFGMCLQTLSMDRVEVGILQPLVRASTLVLSNR